MENSDYLEVTENFLIGNAPSLWLGGIISRRKFLLLLLAMVALFSILFGRLFYLQINKGSYYRQLTEGNRLRLEIIPANRGIIFDLYEQPLVSNEPSFSLIVYPQEIKKEQANDVLATLSRENAAAVDLVKEVYSQPKYFPLVVAENLTYEQAIGLKIKMKDFNGWKLEVDPVRHYFFDGAMSHVLGYTSRITEAEKEGYLQKGYLLTEKVGRSGLEEQYQDILHGQAGKMRIEVDSLGREQKIIAQEDSVPGANLILNVDAGLQEQIVKTLKRLAPGRSGAVVALDPNNGEIRALVSWPTFNHNAFSQGISNDDYQKIINDKLNPLFNRSISGEYPPGSTIKIILGAAALQEKLISRTSQILSVGGVWYEQWFFPDWKEGGHGYVNIISALANSVNTFFYYLALESFDGHQGLGLTKMLTYLANFGLGKETGVDLNQESSGFLPSAAWKEQVKGEAWYPGDTLHLAIGQGDILATPLQVACYTAAIANGGTLYRPHLIHKIIEPGSGKITEVLPEIESKIFINKINFDIIREGMRAAVTNGSARGVASAGINLAGKTGTAQSSSNKPPHAWFTSFGPYEKSSLVITVLIENGGEGSETAVPIAREIWQWYDANRLK